MRILQNIEVSLLITNDSNAPVNHVAKENNISTATLEGIQGKKFTTKQEREIAREKFDQSALDILRKSRITLIALAGFMQVLGRPIVEEYEYRIMNIHPAKDMTRFGGRGMYGEHVHEAVIRSGAKESGCTVHYVDQSVDGGPIILQTTVPVEENDTPESLAQRILIQEHRTYSKAIQLHVDERIKLVNGKAVIDWSSGWEEKWNKKQETLIKHQATAALGSS